MSDGSLAHRRAVGLGLVWLLALPGCLALIWRALALIWLALPWVGLALQDAGPPLNWLR